MKLDRDLNRNGAGKYALIKLRIPDAVVFSHPDPRIFPTMGVVKRQAVDFGDTEDSDFFVIRLKDKYAAPALAAYAMAAYADDPEYALAILNLAKKAAEHPAKRKPD